MSEADECSATSVLSPTLQHINQWSASPWWNKELHLRRRPGHHSSVPYLLTNREYNWRGTGWTDRVQNKQQSACQSRQVSSHSVSYKEQKHKKIIGSVMEWSWSKEHCSSQILMCNLRHDVELQTARTVHQDKGSYPQQSFGEIN